MAIHTSSRRHFLGLAGAAVTASAVGGSLAGCGSQSGGDSGGAAASADLKLPTYQEFAGVQPDLAGDASGLQPAYLSFPTEFAKSTTKAPLSSPVTALTETFATPPPAMSDNGFWQRLNSALGADLSLTIGTDPGYPEKFATTLASNDLPDLMWVPPNQGIPNVGPMLEAKFTDLTKYLSGDAVLEYPNLAALKADSWRTAVVNGKIWGAPIPSTPFGQVMCGNPALWDKVGGFAFDSAQDFFDKASEVSDPRSKIYALEPAYLNMMHMFGEWYGSPTGWRVNADRTMTWQYETDEYQAALEFAAKCFQAGLFYPDASLPDARPRVAQGTIAAYVSVGPTGIGELRQFDRSIQADALIPFGWDGKATPVYDMGYGTVGFTPFKQADESRIRELLALVDYLSAPFGTQEWVQKNYGTEGMDYSIDKSGNAALTKSGLTDAPGLVSALQIMTAPESVIYNAEFPEDAKAIHAAEQKLLEFASQSPIKGLYSDSASRLGAKINSPITDAVTDVVTGRATLADFKTAVQRWRKSGGDKIRSEYEAVLPDSVPASAR